MSFFSGQDGVYYQRETDEIMILRAGETKFTFDGYGCVVRAVKMYELIAREIRHSSVAIKATRDLIYLGDL